MSQVQQLKRFRNSEAWDDKPAVTKASALKSGVYFLKVNSISKAERYKCQC